MQSRPYPDGGCPSMIFSSKRIGKLPIRRLPSRGNTFPYTTFDHCCPWRSAWHTPPDSSPQTPPCFLACGVGCVGAAPATPQAQGLLTSRPQARRLPLAPVVPQKTVGALPCPIVDRSQLAWLPGGSRCHLAPGRGVAGLTPLEGSSLSGGAVRTKQTYGSQPFFLPVSHPTCWLDLSPKLWGYPRASGRA